MRTPYESQNKKQKKSLSTASVRDVFPRETSGGLAAYNTCTTRRNRVSSVYGKRRPGSACPDKNRPRVARGDVPDITNNKTFQISELAARPGSGKPNRANATQRTTRRRLWITITFRFRGSRPTVNGRFNVINGPKHVVRAHDKPKRPRRNVVVVRRTSRVPNVFRSRRGR